VEPMFQYATTHQPGARDEVSALGGTWIAPLQTFLVSIHNIFDPEGLWDMKTIKGRYRILAIICSLF
jgi:hypothetical protein